MFAQCKAQWYFVSDDKELIAGTELCHAIKWDTSGLNPPEPGYYWMLCRDKIDATKKKVELGYYDTKGGNGFWFCALTRDEFYSRACFLIETSLVGWAPVLFNTIVVNTPKGE